MADYEEIRKLYAKTLVEVTSNASLDVLFKDSSTHKPIQFCRTDINLRTKTKSNGMCGLQSVAHTDAQAGEARNKRNCSAGWQRKIKVSV